MQIWRMQSDGTNQEQLTFDDNSNWFAHPSPDNKWIAFISYMSDEKQNHFGKHVQLKLMNIATKQIQVLLQFLWRSRHFQCPILSSE
jgi:Tol biopolymer transport system component